MAKSRGIEIVSSTSDEAGQYKNLIRVVLHANGDSISVAGTLFSDKGPRMVEINGSMVDIEPEGNFLLIGHEDKPGMIGSVGTVLGDNDVNIASMEVARRQPRGPAMMILHIDEGLKPEVLEKVRAIPSLKSATYIRL
jgi:D-3-phosphoglycerate dehydrogenase